MEETHEPEHTFRITHGMGEEYIAADYMATASSGMLELWVRNGNGPVASFVPCHGLSVVRVDILITMEGLTQT